MVGISQGIEHWSMTRDSDGHRTYRARYKVTTTDVYDGPFIVLQAAGIPFPGQIWAYGNDVDPWAFCTTEHTCTPVVDEELNRYWIVEATFTTKPQRRPQQRCQDVSIEDPLLEPPKISGTFTKFNRETDVDIVGEPILNSSRERVPGIEREDNRPCVIIEQNWPTLGLDVFSQMIDTLNDAPMWGLPAETIKLTNVSWSRNLYGVCNYYYTRRFEFDINYEGWVRDKIPDQGFRKFNRTRFAGEPTEEDRADPDNYIQIKDKNDNDITRPMLLDGYGGILGDYRNVVYIPPVYLYNVSNFLLLGVPATLA